MALRADWQLMPVLLFRYWPSVLKLLPLVGVIGGAAGLLMDRELRDPWVRRSIDLECFLLSGLKAEGTVAPEIAFLTLFSQQQCVVPRPLDYAQEAPRDRPSAT
ncbi:MAG: hypothetical protein ACM65L_13450 [Microcoleus sp.]